MGFGKVDLYDGDGRLRKDFDTWFLYAAFTRPAKTDALVKIGITKVPLDRLFEIHSTSPFPVEVALWVEVGGNSLVRKLEASIGKALAARNTRGEWFRFDLTKVDDKREFHDVMRAQFQSHTGRPLVWKKSNLDQIRAFAASKPKSRKRGRKRWGPGPNSDTPPFGLRY